MRKETESTSQHPIPAGVPACIPADGFLRLKEVLRFFPVSRSSWYRGIKEGIYPRGVPLGPRTAAWRAEDIRRLIVEMGAKA